VRVQITPLAAKNLEMIADYIAEDSHNRAITFVAELRVKFKQIAQNPEGFRRRGELAACRAMAKSA
jgi:plasmid stabilization system protein ParE